MVRSDALPAMENVALWHERDISHSSVERFIGPDATITLDFALARLTGVVDKLLVYPERMQKNLDRMGGLVHSQRVLLALTQAGLSREDSYALVQRNAMKVWEFGRRAVAARPAQGRPRGLASVIGRRTRAPCSTSTITSSTSTRSSPGCSVPKAEAQVQPAAIPARTFARLADPSGVREHARLPRRISSTPGRRAARQLHAGAVASRPAQQLVAAAQQQRDRPRLPGPAGRRAAPLRRRLPGARELDPAGRAAQRRRRLRRMAGSRLAG